jgi:putative membrane protein
VVALIGGLGLAGWDLYLDPQMVAQGHWSWADPTPALPGVPGVPLTNYAGWLLVSVLMIAVLDRVLPRGQPERLDQVDQVEYRDPRQTGLPERRFGQDHGRNSELVPAAVLAWTWCGSAVGNVMFFGRPWVALYGGLVMGLVVLPYLLQLRTAATNSASTMTNPADAAPNPAHATPNWTHATTNPANTTPNRAIAGPNHRIKDVT